MSGNVGDKPSFFPKDMQKDIIEKPKAEPLKKENLKPERSSKNSVTDTIDNNLPYTVNKTLNNTAITPSSKKQSQHSSSGALRASPASSSTIPLGTEETKSISGSKSTDSLKNAINEYKTARSNFIENKPVSFPVYISPHSPATYGSIESQEAAFALTAIHDAASEGSYHFGTKLAQILDLTQRKLSDGRLYRSSELRPETKQAWIAQINESRQKILFLQDCRLFLNEIKGKWSGQKHILPEQKIALEHLSLAILSKVRLGTSVALPLDFISPHPEDNHATVLGIEPHTNNNIPENLPAAIISIYETNGDMSRRIVPHE